MHYVPIKCSRYNEYTTPLYNIQGRMNALGPYIIISVE